MNQNTSNVSDKIINYLQELFGNEEVENYLQFISQNTNQYIRVNRLKISVQDLQKLLQKDYNIHSEKIESIPGALKIISDENKLLSKTIEHITGKYYIQSLSSMVPPLVLSPCHDDIVLDLCSAPGSKTTQLAEMMNNKGTLIANEVQMDRLKSLVYNIDRMSISNAGIMHTKGEWLQQYYENHFDKILVDAPCSGLGIIQKKGEVSNWWSVDRVKNLSDLQYKLLVAAVKMCKPGGEIVYSTCTMTIEENEMVIDKVCSKYPLEIVPVEVPVNSVEAFTSFKENSFIKNLNKAKRIIPWKINSEGFFLVKLRKTEYTQPNSEIKKITPSIIFTPHNKLSHFFSQLNDEFGINENIFHNYKYIVKTNDIFFVDANWVDDYPDKFTRIGIKFGSIDKNKKFILHTNAVEIFQKYISKKIITLQDNNELKKYLEGGIIKRETGLRGQVVIKYKYSIIGTAVVSDNGIKSRFPRAKRTQEIHKD